MADVNLYLSLFRSEESIHILSVSLLVSHVLVSYSVSVLIVRLNYVLNLKKQNKFLSKHKLSPVNLTWLSQVYGKMFNLPKC